MKRRGLSLFLVLSMLLGSVPVSAVEAVEYPTVTAEVEKPDTGISTAALTGTVSGYGGGEGDGTNLSWTLTQDGTLTISGTGAMSTFSFNSTAAWRAYGDDIKNVCVESGVTSIGRFAFYACDNLTSVTIGNDVTTIGESAFEECAALVSVSMGNSVADIGKSAFKYCDNLTNVTLPVSVTSIGESAFYDCDSLVNMTIPQRVTRIRSNTFHSCDGLTSVTIPDGLTTINSYAFAYCSSLPEVELPDSVKTIGEYAFSGCKSLEKIEIPDAMTSIGLAVFLSCENLMHVTIPDHVTSIGDYAFSRCSNLTSVEIGSGVTSIGRYTFAQCSSLKDLKVSENNSAFCAVDSVLYSKDMTQLLMLPASKEGHFTIPNGVTSIGRFAVYECDFLTSVTIPASVTMIDWNAFYLCDNLKSVFFAGNAPSVYPTSYTAPSFAPDVTLHYIPGTSGWTGSGFYDAAAGTWNGYELTMWEHGKRFIAPLFGTTIEINGEGYGYGYYIVTDDVGSPLSGIPVVVQFDGTTLKRVTDGNGVIRVKTPEVSKNCIYDLTFEMPGFKKTLHGAQQTLEIVVDPLSYEETWSGSLGSEIGLSLSAGSGAEVGVASFDATAAKASAKAGVNGQLSVTDAYENKDRTLTLNYTYDNSVGVQFKAGATATVPMLEIAFVSAKAGATAVSQSQAGLKIENYDPSNGEQAAQVSLFALQTALVGNQSVWVNKLMNALEVGVHNRSANVSKLIVDAGASVGAIVISQKLPSGSGNAENSSLSTKDEFKIAGVGTTSVYSVGTEKDLLEGKEVRFVKFETDANAGILELPTSLTGAGFVKGNFAKISAEYNDSDKALNELQIKLYDERKAKLSWSTSEKEKTTEIVMDADQAASFAIDEPALERYLNREELLLTLDEMHNVLLLLQKNPESTIKRAEISKKGWEVDLPFGLEFIAGAKIGLKGSFVNEMEVSRGIERVKNGEIYPVCILRRPVAAGAVASGH